MFILERLLKDKMGRKQLAGYSLVSFVRTGELTGITSQCLETLLVTAKTKGWKRRPS
jgi:hypothetical protein